MPHWNLCSAHWNLANNQTGAGRTKANMIVLVVISCIWIPKQSLVLEEFQSWLDRLFILWIILPLGKSHIFKDYQRENPQFPTSTNGDEIACLPGCSYCRRWIKQIVKLRTLLTVKHVPPTMEENFTQLAEEFYSVELLLFSEEKTYMGEISQGVQSLILMSYFLFFWAPFLAT